MSDEKYKKVLAWSKENGLKLHPNLERKCVNGVYGMYAKGDISKNELIAEFPKENLLPILKDFKYPEGLPQNYKFIHAAVKELAKGDSGWGFMKGLYEDAYFEQYNSYYYTDEELQLLKSLDELLYEYVIMAKNKIDSYVNTICSFDKEVDKKLLVRIILNFNNRAWWDVGFIPILDMFNHSDLHGGLRGASDTAVFHNSTKDYKKGDQILISYGKKDIYQYAIDYGYFDPEGHHCLDLGSRIMQTAKSDFQKKIFQHIKNKYKVNHKVDASGAITYQLLPGQAFLLEHAPNITTIDFIRDVSFKTEEELANQNSHNALFRWRMLQYIDGLDKRIKVDEVDLGSIPEKMQYFHHMLVRVKQILKHNREWVILNTPYTGS